MEAVQIQNINLVELKEIIQQHSLATSRDLIIEAFLNRFDGIEVTSDVVTSVWKIDKATLVSYIKNNVIKPINPGSSKHLFNLKDILVIDNPKYRRIR